MLPSPVNEVLRPVKDVMAATSCLLLPCSPEVPPRGGAGCRVASLLCCSSSYGPLCNDFNK